MQVTNKKIWLESYFQGEYKKWTNSFKLGNSIKIGSIFQNLNQHFPLQHDKGNTNISHSIKDKVIYTIKQVQTTQSSHHKNWVVLKLWKAVVTIHKVQGLTLLYVFSNEILLIPPFIRKTTLYIIWAGKRFNRNWFDVLLFHSNITIRRNRCGIFWL